MSIIITKGDVHGDIHLAIMETSAIFVSKDLADIFTAINSETKLKVIDGFMALKAHRHTKNELLLITIHLSDDAHTLSQNPKPPNP